MSVRRLRSPRSLALLLGVVTFLAWTVERFRWDVADLRVGFGVDIGPLAQVVLAVVAVTTLGIVEWFALGGHGPRAAAVVLAGPLVAVGASFALHWALFGSSTDSPTWLVYLALCAGAAVAGGVAYGLGVAVRRLRSRTESA